MLRVRTAEFPGKLENVRKFLCETTSFGTVSNFTKPFHPIVPLQL